MLFRNVLVFQNFENLMRHYLGVVFSNLCLPISRRNTLVARFPPTKASEFISSDADTHESYGRRSVFFVIEQEFEQCPQMCFVQPSNNSEPQTSDHAELEIGLRPARANSLKPAWGLTASS